MIADLEYVGDFTAFSTFASAYPYLVEYADHEQAKRSFTDIVTHEINNKDYYSESPEEIRQYAESMGELAFYFDVDIEEDLKYLENCAYEKEQEMSMPDDEDSTTEYSNSSGEVHIDDIDALFTSLIETSKS